MYKRQTHFVRLFEKSQGVLPQEQTYKAAIAGCRVRKGVDGPKYLERLERVVKAIGRRGVDPTKDVKMRIAVACVHAKKWDKAAALFESSVRECWSYKRLHQLRNC